MALLTAKGLSVSFQGVSIFSDVSLSIEEGVKYALVGKNGAGKTTLFRVLTGELLPDDGEIFVSSAARTAYFSQNPVFGRGRSVIEELYENFSHLRELHRRLEKAAEEMDRSPEAFSLYQSLWEEFERKGGLDYETEIKKVLTGLNLTSLEQSSVDTLSGGEKMRLGLARLLLSQPDIMLLDEPTNHLDLGSVRWLAGYLNAFRGSVILVSHDRYLLDAVVTRVLDLEGGSLTLYKGNYTQFRVQKNEDMAYQEKLYQRQKREAEALEAYIRKYKAGNRSTQAKSRENRLKRLTVVDRPARFQYRMSLDLNGFQESGHEVLRVSKMRVRDLYEVRDLHIRKGDKVGIIGPNGSGKTSFFRAIREGKPGVRWGHNIRISLFDQELSLYDHSLSLTAYLNRFYDLDEFEARQALGHFHFSGEEAYKIIGSLSGGERSRFKLLTVMLESPNVIMMDEPTNHLDMDFIDILEEALSSYRGTLLAISHDFYFLKRLCRSFIRIADNRFVTGGPGLLDLEAGISSEKKDGGKAPEGDQGEYGVSKKERNQIKKKKEMIIRCEERIHACEEALAALEDQMHARGDDFAFIQSMEKERRELQRELSDCYKEWEELHGAEGKDPFND